MQTGKAWQTEEEQVRGPGGGSLTGVEERREVSEAGREWQGAKTRAGADYVAPGEQLGSLNLHSKLKTSYDW